MSQTTARAYIDCRDFPNETGCSLRISGTRDEVLAVAAHHAVASHGHADSADLRAQLDAAIAPEAAS
jgi:hypothetical protein